MFKFIKRTLDIFWSFLGLLSLAPFLLLIAIIIKIDSKGPAIFKQTRSGKDGKLFVMYKFRTMKTTHIPFDINNPVIESVNNNLTRIGHGLRKLKIDELPQLLNVLKGEMSIIGPRPFLPIYVDQYEDWEFYRLKVRPGLTGYSQLNGNEYLTNPERIYYDLVYIQKISFWYDFKIFFKTFAILLFGEKKYYKAVVNDDIEKLKTEILKNTEEVQKYKNLVLENNKIKPKNKS